MCVCILYIHCTRFRTDDNTALHIHIKTVSMLKESASATGQSLLGHGESITLVDQGKI